MGLFDFFRRKKANSEPEDIGSSPEYLMAHYALRHIALANPLQFLEIVASPKAEKFFKTILEGTADDCGCKIPFPASAIEVHKTRVNHFPCAVIQFPEPKDIAEAYMVALVVMIDASSEPPEIEDLSEIQARFFTLERGFSLSDEENTVLGQWTDKTHINHGAGPDPSVDEFVKALGEFFE